MTSSGIGSAASLVDAERVDTGWKARDCEALAATCDGRKRSTAPLQGFKARFGALLVFLIGCAPGDADGTDLLGLASDRKTTRASDDRQARAGHAPNRLEIQDGLFIAAGFRCSCRGYRFSDCEWNRF